MDWTTSFQALTDKTRASYRSLLGEWQELLTKVAQGEVAPSVLEDRLPQFLQDEGADFYRRLSALSFELFNGLSELQAGTTTEFIRGLLGDCAIAESPPPSAPRLPDANAAPEEWTRWYQGVTAFMTEQNEFALRRYQVVLEKVADGRLTPASVQEFSRKFLNERALVFSRDAGELQMRFYARLLQLNQEFVASLFAGLARGANGPFADSDSPIQIECLESGSSAAEKATSPVAGADPQTSGTATDDGVVEPTDFRPTARSDASRDLTIPAAPSDSSAKAKRKRKSPARGRKKKAAR